MFLLCICVCFLSSCGNVKENTESQVSEAKKFKNYASDIWSASGNKITFGNKIILTSYRILQIMPVKHGFPMKLII